MLKVVTDKPVLAEDVDQMQEKERRFQLAKILQSTEDILNHAQAGDWDTVECLEQERQVQLSACFAQSHHGNTAMEIETLAALLQMNKEITQLVENAKQDLVNEQVTIENRQLVAREYEKSS